MKQHVDKELSYLVMAAQTSLEVFDLLDQIKGRLPQRSPTLGKSYLDFYAKLLTIVTLFFENRLERGRATLMGWRKATSSSTANCEPS